MTYRSLSLGLFLGFWTCSISLAQPPGDKEPLLRLEAGGPTSYVTALTFSRDGKTLYAAGWDKVVRAWSLNDRGEFVLQTAAYRVPLGPGRGGAINAIALSEDGNWLAVGGLGVFRGEAGFRQDGLIFPAASSLGPEMSKDLGTIYLFNTRTGAVRLLRGHRGDVRSLAFAPSYKGKPLLLVSAGQELNTDTQETIGTVRLWNADTGKYLDGLSGLPAPDGRPGVAVWHSGSEVNQLRIALTWNDGTFRVWHADRKEGWLRAVSDNVNNNTVAYDPGSRRLVSGTRGRGTARLKLWMPMPVGWIRLLTGNQHRQEDQLDCAACALALMSSEANAKFDFAAVVNWLPKEGDEYRLQVLGLAGAEPGKSRPISFSGRAVRDSRYSPPPEGKYLAVAGGASNEIRIYPVKDLLANKATPKVIVGAGSTIRYASFVKLGKETGLLLNEAVGEEAGAGTAGAARGRP